MTIPQPSARLAQVAVRLYVSGEADEEQLRRVWEETLGKSPLVHTFRPAVTLDLRLNIVP